MRLDVRLAARLDHVADEIIETRRALFALAAALKLQRLDGPRLAADFRAALETVGLTPQHALREWKAMLQLINAR